MNINYLSIKLRLKGRMEGSILDSPKSLQENALHMCVLTNMVSNLAMKHASYVPVRVTSTFRILYVVVPLGPGVPELPSI